MIEGRTLATVGDQVVAAERPYGSGSVTLIGFDPTVDWIAKTDTSRQPVAPAAARPDDRRPHVHRRQHAGAGGLPAPDAGPPADHRPARPADRLHRADRPDQLPRPQRLDRREWAWITMPILIVVFAAGAYAYGAVAPRERRHRQRDRHRARRSRRDRGLSAGLPRGLLAIAQRLPGQRPGRRAPVDIDQRRHVRRRRDGDRARRPPGRPGAGAGPGSGFRVAADDPGRDTGRRPAHRGRPPARGRPSEGHGEECVEHRRSSVPRSSSARRSPSSTISSQAPRRRWTSRCSSDSSPRACRTRSSARCSETKGR